MTRQEFIDDVVGWPDLISFCCDYGYDYIDDIYSEDARDDYINEHLVEMARNADDWSSLYDELSEIPTGYDYYRLTDYGEWEGLGNHGDFDDFKNDVLEWADDEDIWEEDEEEPIDDDDDDDDFVVEDEPISIGELIGACSSQLQQIGDNKRTEEAAEDEAFEDFVSGCVTIAEGE